MGWLRELMQLADPPVEGYGELARRVLGHPEWPADTQPQPRSLAALFSKLDRGIEVEWLAERDAVQRTLALTLGCPLQAVRGAIAPPGAEESAGARLRWEDLPFARPFDFRQEPLPPGIPAQLLRPSLWRRTWWRAPSGSGRSLTGQWLAARGLASFVSARSWSEAANRLPEAGPTFVELERQAGFDPLDPGLDREGICIAAPFGPLVSPPGSQLGRAWDVVESPPLSEALNGLLEWLAERLPEDGAFDVVAARAWLAGPLHAGAIPTLGALLGVAGQLDARGARAALGKDLGKLAAAFVNERLEQASVKGSAEAQWLKLHGFDVLVKLAESALTGGDEPWATARSQDEWIALIPAEFQQSVDTEWVRWSLSRAGGQTTARELDRALRNVPPGAYRIVRALVDARLLRERGLGGLVVAPEFLKHAALDLARERLIGEGSPFSWGEALLRPHAAPGILDALQRRFMADDFSLLDGLLELDLQTQPALIVATEAALTCLGLRVLQGAEVPTEHLEAIWNEQNSWLVELPGELPRPRLLCFAGEPSCALADHAVWALAALAIAEVLGDTEGVAHPVLRPWRMDRAVPQLHPLLDRIHATVLRPEVSELGWAVEAFALAGRLQDHFRSDDPDAEPMAVHALSRPAQLVRALLDGDLDDALQAHLGLHPLERRALQKECELQRVTWPRMAQALWKSWHAQGCPAPGDALFGPASPCHAELWPELPADVLELCWSRWASAPATWPFHCFGRAQWSAFVSRWSRHWQSDPTCHVWASAFQSMDQEWAERAQESGKLLELPDSHVLPLLFILWRRFPTPMLAALGKRLGDNDPAAFGRLLRSAPVDADGDVLRLLSEGLSRRTTERAILDEARRWLSERIAARGREWRLAYGLFVELERRRARSLRARGA